MAIANAQPNVLKVLNTIGIGEVVSVNPRSKRPRRSLRLIAC